MKRIIVAGAGHGGLVCAANLAAKGYDVTVFEAKQREEIGYDWEDAITKTIFDSCNIERPDDSDFLPFLQQAYYNPKKNVRIVIPKKENNPIFTIDRKVLINHLINCAEKAGAKICFGSKVISAVTDGENVTGIVADTENGEQEFLCDLVVDAAGIDSPVRKSLPSCCGIKNEFNANDTFYVYRAYYKNLTGETSDAPYNIYFFHCKKCGMDWAITYKDCIDILVGSFGPMKEDDIKNAIGDFRKEYPNMSSEIVRGGSIEKIPLRRTLPIIVCNGYACVGDSASMTEAMTGSGIRMSMKAGKMLSETVLNIGSKSFTKDALWDYQYKYFTKVGNKELSNEQLKHFLVCVGSDGMDYLLENGIITQAELKGGKLKYNASQLLDKGKKLIKRPEILKQMIKMLIGNAKVKSVRSTMPEIYDEKKIDLWQKKYENLLQ